MGRKSPFQSKNLNDTHDIMTFMTLRSEHQPKFGPMFLLPCTQQGLCIKKVRDCSRALMS